jgi:hypothetical protein
MHKATTSNARHSPKSPTALEPWLARSGPARGTWCRFGVAWETPPQRSDPRGPHSASLALPPLLPRLGRRWQQHWLPQRLSRKPRGGNRDRAQDTQSKYALPALASQPTHMHAPPPLPLRARAPSTAGSVVAGKASRMTIRAGRFFFSTCSSFGGWGGRGKTCAEGAGATGTGTVCRSWRAARGPACTLHCK